MQITKNRLLSLRNLTLFILLNSIARKMDTHIYLVGGGLRDLIGLSRWMDIDFAVQARCRDVAADVARLMQGTSFPLGEKYECYRVVVAEKDGRREMDFTPLRGMTIEEDLENRDFTMNAMALSVRALFEDREPEIIDPFCGMDDFRRGVVKLVADEAIDDDPLRMLRGFRLAATHALQIDGRFLSLCEKKGVKLNQVSPERIRTELFKTLASPGATPYLRQMVALDLLQEILPEMRDWQAVDSGDACQYSLFEHSLRTLAHVESILREECHHNIPCEKEVTAHLAQTLEYGIDRSSMLKFAALLHDSGKPGTFRRTGTKVTFYNHDESGASINKAIARRLKIGRAARRVLANITRQHMRILHLSKLESITERAMDRFIRDCGSETPEILLLALADTWATREARTVEHTDVEGVVQRLMERVFNRRDERGRQFLSGRDVMAILGIGQGVEVGQCLEMLREEDLAGRIKNRADAITFLKRYKLPG